MSGQAQWLTTTATVTRCRRTIRSFFEAGVISQTAEIPEPTTYVAFYEYYVSGRRYSGRYERSTPVDPGHKFDLSYNPNQPSQNTGGDLSPLPTLARVVIWILTGMFVAGAIYLDHRFRS